MAAFGFTPASNQDVFCIGPEQSSSKINSKCISGEEARQFYEDLVKDGKEQDPPVNNGNYGRERRLRQDSRKSNRRIRRRGRAVEGQQPPAGSLLRAGVGGESGSSSHGGSSSEGSGELQGLRLLRFAHEGDVSGLKELLSKGVDINFQDTFLWTAVMCASWSGQRAAVRLLLGHGAAWVGVVDLQGRDAQDLALEAGHSELWEELMSYGQSPQREAQSEHSAVEPQWCDVCCSEYRSAASSHFSSTLHQFNLRRPPPTPYYCLPPSSNSYRMMLRCGWEPGTGLGPEGGGPQQPVPTVLKRDQKGLGYGQARRARVTHFQARDRDAVEPLHRQREERSQKGLRREEAKRKELKDKSWERDFRASFYL
ncbi:unnamed protein product [Menidia menidia]|uniref:(Atlantic silverside) hypothetical protein n=1 Tax=Menidia menidia TaxID=238744 RepID=A0A8S4BBK1_9TELE|nr:unnamed protein product [Menidia menidia]